MEGEGDDDEDPDGLDSAISDCQIQQFQILITQKVPTIHDDDFQAPTPYTAPPWWRKSEIKKVGIRRVEGVAGRGSPMVSHCQIQPFLNTKKVPANQDDDFLASIPYTAPPTQWRKSESKLVGIQQVDRTVVGGEGVGVRREGTGDRVEQYSTHQRGMKMGGPEGLCGAAIHAPECTGAVG